LAKNDLGAEAFAADLSQAFEKIKHSRAAAPVLVGRIPEVRVQKVAAILKFTLRAKKARDPFRLANWKLENHGHRSHVLSFSNHAAKEFWALHRAMKFAKDQVANGRAADEVLYLNGVSGQRRWRGGESWRLI